jgi:hypothetical protein
LEQEETLTIGDYLREPVQWRDVYANAYWALESRAGHADFVDVVGVYDIPALDPPHNEPAYTRKFGVTLRLRHPRAVKTLGLPDPSEAVAAIEQAHHKAREAGGVWTL